MEKEEKGKKRDDGWIAFTQVSSASQVKCRYLLTLNYMQVIDKLILTPWGAPIKACQISAIKFDSNSRTQSLLLTSGALVRPDENF